MKKKDVVSLCLQCEHTDVIVLLITAWTWRHKKRIFSLQCMSLYIFCVHITHISFGEFKRFDSSIYRNLRELSLFITRLGFGMLTVGNQLYFDCICWLVPVATDTCKSVSIQSNIVWNWCKKIHKSMPELRNGKLCKYCLLYSSGEILESVARSLFTRTINEHTRTIANVCLYLCFQLRIMYIKYIFFKLTITLKHYLLIWVYGNWRCHSTNQQIIVITGTS